MKIILIIAILFILSGTVYPGTLISDETVKQQKLVNIQALDPSIGVRLMYATTNNFLGKNVYGDLRICYLRREAADKLTNAQRILKVMHKGYSLLVYDGLRPRRVQFMMWDIVKDTPKAQYVGYPLAGSIHNYGAAVDLTITDDSGMPLDMGTPFDYFGPKAQPRYEEYYLKPALLERSGLDKKTLEQIKVDMNSSGLLNDTEISNRLLLRRVMEEAGFQPIVNEWWHFNAFPNAVVKKMYKIIE
jgi:D-alanyl-D-alanine dipeptidase